MRTPIPDEKKLVHESIIPLRWGDMDAFSHINNTVYFRYMEQGRIHWIESLGFLAKVAKEGALVANAFCNFYIPVSYPGDLLVRTYTGKIGRTSADTYNVMSLTSAPDEVVAAGGATLVWVNLETNRPAQWPDAVYQLLK
ncbi:MAG: acyl-CoA thioesterase [Polynucleobacter sp.]|jgi:acyl-CoA thioester hydrolase|nr:acyl-CoA thioesterase [Polynucleobacter sp.]